VSVVGTMQESLERALHKARLADDREVMGRVRAEGHRLVFLLNGVIRGSRLYASDNAALESPSRDAATVLRGLVDLLGSAQIACVEDHIYVNDVRLRVQPHEQPAIDVFIAELSRHGVGGITFHGPLSPESVKSLARQISAPAREGDPRTALAAQLVGLPEVQVRGRFRFRLKGEAPATRSSWREILERGAAAAAAAMGTRRIANPIPVRRAVIELVEGLREDPGRATAPVPGQTPGERHLLSVTNLGLRLGVALGLDDAALSDLGVAAMFHDVGYAKGADKEHHASEGMRALLKQRGFHEGKIRRLRAVLEHHDPHGPGVSLFARILKIVDDYDILTARHADGHPSLPPPMAQGAMWAARGIAYDPDLLALFAQIMGAYPPTSLLELSDGRWGVVTSGGRDKERFVWPVVRIVREADGGEADGRKEEDLFLRREHLRPKRVVNPATINVDVAPMLERVFRSDA
jgi:HD domain